MGVLVEPERVEQIELGLGTPVADFRDAGPAQVLLRLLGDEPRVAGVRLAADRVHDVADQEKRLMGKNRVDRRRVGVRHEEHVALVDRLESADARAVKSEAVLEAVDLQLADGQAEMLPGAGKVDETHVDDLDALCFRPLEHFARTGLAHRFGFADRFCLYCHEHPPRDSRDLTGPTVIVGRCLANNQVRVLRTRAGAFRAFDTKMAYPQPRVSRAKPTSQAVLICRVHTFWRAGWQS